MRIQNNQPTNNPSFRATKLSLCSDFINTKVETTLPKELEQKYLIGLYDAISNGLIHTGKDLPRDSRSELLVDKFLKERTPESILKVNYFDDRSRLSQAIHVHNIKEGKLQEYTEIKKDQENTPIFEMIVSKLKGIINDKK